MGGANLTGSVFGFFPSGTEAQNSRNQGHSTLNYILSPFYFLRYRLAELQVELVMLLPQLPLVLGLQGCSTVLF